MPDYIVSAPSITSLTVEGTTERFPVRRIICVGRNYAAHAREMGKDPERDPPFFFTKPADAAFDAGASDEAQIPYPPETQNFHYEAELTVAIGLGGVGIADAAAMDHVLGFCTSIDLTRRDLQLEAREKGRPWDWGKAFDLSAPIGPIVRKEDAPDLDLRESAIRLHLDGEVKQDAVLGELIWSVPEIISTISHSIELKPGDLIMTGTPAGVGPIKPGQTMMVEIAGLPDTVLKVTEKRSRSSA
ncbi:MAG: fumarylacetoacetate hydrolase family protein [Pseudomonadota bacterium]